MHRKHIDGIGAHPHRARGAESLMSSQDGEWLRLWLGATWKMWDARAVAEQRKALNLPTPRAAPTTDRGEAGRETQPLLPSVLWLRSDDSPDETTIHQRANDAGMS